MSLVLGMESWAIGVGATIIMVLSYAVIAYILIEGLAHGRQWAVNPIGVATALVFVSCTLGHGAHVVHALLPSLGVDVPRAMAARAVFEDPRLWVWNLGAAVVAIWYLSLRNRLKVVYGGAALCEDMANRQKEALDIHDNVVQGLAEAKLALDLGERARALSIVDDTLADAKHLITDILGEEGSQIALGAGDLRREQPGGSS